jgi:hypothetical protein
MGPDAASDSAADTVVPGRAFICVPCHLVVPFRRQTRRAWPTEARRRGPNSESDAGLEHVSSTRVPFASPAPHRPSNLMAVGSVCRRRGALSPLGRTVNRKSWLPNSDAVCRLLGAIWGCALVCRYRTGAGVRACPLRSACQRSRAQDGVNHQGGLRVPLPRLTSAASLSTGSSAGAPRARRVRWLR